MKFIYYRIAILLLIPSLILLSSCQKKQQDATQVDSTSIQAKSMICSTYVNAVKKAVNALDGVQEVHVDLNAKIVEVKYVRERTSVSMIEQAITAAGYDANDKKRDPAAYEKLPACCKKEVGS
jgi:periplasmic mercuric ion binding protein